MKPLKRLIPFVLMLALAGCPLTHDDPEPTKCRSSEDCFSGEWCDKAKDPEKVIGECRPYLDSGILDKGPRPPDAKPTPDAPAGDLPDAGPTPDGDLGAQTDQGKGDLGDLGASQ